MKEFLFHGGLDWTLIPVGALASERQADGADQSHVGNLAALPQSASVFQGGESNWPPFRWLVGESLPPGVSLEPHAFMNWA